MFAVNFTASADNIYKQVDDEGTVKFTDKPNAEAKKVDVETPNVATTPLPESTKQSSSVSKTKTEKTSAKNFPQKASKKDTEKDNSRTPSLTRQEKERAQKQAELDGKCEAARQQAMIPKKQEIYQECMSKGRKEESECRNDADSYNGNQGVHKPLYYNLPECEAAHKHKRSYRSAD